MRNGCLRIGGVVLLLGAAACLGACTEDDLEPSCTTETGEPYMRPCACETGGIGVRLCDANGAWGLCSCPGQGVPTPVGGTGGPTSGAGGMSVAPTPDAATSVDAGPTTTPDAGGDAATTGCTMDVDCAAPTPACDTTAGACVACTMDVHCAPATCNTATHTCASGCTSNAGCSAPTPACDTATGTCVECTAMSDCSGATPECGPNHACVACVMHSQCSAAACPLALPCCSATNTCGCSAPFASTCPP